MNSLKVVLAVGVLVLGSSSLNAATATPPQTAAATAATAATSATAPSPIARIVSAANAFLATLEDSQRKKILYPFDDADQRKRWSNLPVALVSRGGISLKEMSADQKAAALKLLSTTLSPAGFEKVQQIMEGDEVNQQQTGRTRKSEPMFGRDLFYISMLGTPSEKTPWMLQFGGHHLALNITMRGERGTLTPTLTGAQPAIYKLGDKTVRPLKGESDKAIALLKSLDAKQRSQAILSYRVANLVLGPGEDGRTIQPEGLEATDMTASQRAMLLDVISEWTGIIEENAAAARMAEMKADLNQTWFAWSGPTDVTAGSNLTAYYRIQGPHLVIEYAPQGGDPAMHIHTMYRDPTNDYGASFISK
jgi:hypothetical protein